MSDYKRLTDEDWLTTISVNDTNDPKLIEYAFRLWQLENQIKNGTLVDLPCKIGDTIYLIRDAEHPKHRRILECKVYGLIIQKTPIHIQFKAISENRYDYYGYFDVDDIGKIAFFTKIEAETRLAKLKGGDK